MSRSDTERLRDILECIEAIDRAEATVRRYPGDPDVAKVAMDAVQRRVLRSGKPSRHCRGVCVSPDVPWSDMARMRDLIGHHYYKLDPQIVRATIGAPAERLRAACEAILAESDGEEEDRESFEGANPSPATECVRGPLTSGNVVGRPLPINPVGISKLPLFGGNQVRLPQACE